MSKRVTAKGIEFRYSIVGYFSRLCYRIDQETHLAYTDSETAKAREELRREVNLVEDRVYEAFEDIFEEIRAERPLSKAGAEKAIQDTKSEIIRSIFRMLSQCPLNSEYSSDLQVGARTAIDEHMGRLMAKLGVKDV